MVTIKHHRIVVLILTLAVMSLLTVLFVYSQKSLVNEPQNCNQKYPLVSPDIDCTSFNEKINQTNVLRESVDKIIGEYVSQNKVKRVSVFYRDLSSRRWFGIDDTDRFYPASLIKLPISLIYYKIAELEPDILSRTLEIPNQEADANDTSHYFDKSKSLVPGKKYTIQQMIDSMLINSDNTPFATLSDSAKLFRNKVLTDLGVYEPATDQTAESWNVSPRSYAGVYRMLYNASYLNIQYASDILKLLSKSTFTKGIVAGIPANTVVAHKFGEATAVDKDDNVQGIFLNDCGIVYKPDSPYIVCIMTEGMNFSIQEEIIGRISKTIYTGTN